MQIELLEKQIESLQKEKIDMELTVKAKQRIIDSHAETETDLRRQVQRLQDSLRSLERQVDDTKGSDLKRMSQNFELKRTLEDS